MAARKRLRKRAKLLASSRTPIIAKPTSMSRKATRNLIRTHHNLQKCRAKALVSGNKAVASALLTEIESKGGIRSYQKASLLGQASLRGGDSSKILMEWLSPVLPHLEELVRRGQPLRLLEIGALSTENTCSRSQAFEVQRIDLNSQADGIVQQDFMARPLPKSNAEQFDIISLSLVLNYVPDPQGRGDMLRRTVQFLGTRNYPTHIGGSFPSLFLVLPASCVSNSRYLDEMRLEAIMGSLGFTIVQKKLSTKLIYYLCKKASATVAVEFKKERVLKYFSTLNNDGYLCTLVRDISEKERFTILP